MVCKAGAGLCSAAPAPSFLRFAISRKIEGRKHLLETLPRRQGVR